MEHLIELNNVYKIYHMGDEDVHVLVQRPAVVKKLVAKKA